MNSIKKYFPYVLPFLTLGLIIIFTDYSLYFILLSIIAVLIYILKTSPEFIAFFKKNWYVFLMVISAYLFGVFKGDNSFWLDFEGASIAITIVYSIIIYITLYRDSAVQKEAVLKALPFLFVGILLILLSVLAGLGNGLNLVSGNGFGVSLSGERKVTMGLLACGTLFYAMVNYVLMRGESKFKLTYVKSLQYSDIPVVITFMLLWASTFQLENYLGEGEIEKYEAFYGGAVAFQMLYSNIVWAFIDDPIIESMFTNKS